MQVRGVNCQVGGIERLAMQGGDVKSLVEGVKRLVMQVGGVKRLAMQVEGSF